ncbi:MAG: hypothetical protein AB7V18_15290 [Pyrinomonadaceae bacterium]
MKSVYSRKVYDLEKYGCLPGAAADRRSLATQLHALLAKRPDCRIGRMSNNRIPGFWTDDRGNLRLGSEFNFTTTLLLVPIFDRNGMIRACQIRSIGIVPKGCSKYFWFSSAGKLGGSSPGSPLHYAAASLSTLRPILVTEGPLKADIAKAFFADHDIAASAGVSCSHDEIVDAARSRQLDIAFDMDSFTNPHVAGAMARLIGRRLTDQITHGYQDALRILVWDKRANGLDEALIQGRSINSVTPNDWFQRLTPACHFAAKNAFARFKAVGHDLGTVFHNRRKKRLAERRTIEIKDSVHERNPYCAA